MALSGNYISFQSIIEAVYRRAGYQTIDWAEAIEVVAETIRLIGALPAYKDITTNGLNGNPNPLEITDYRVLLPTNLVNLKAIRKVELSETSVDGGTDLEITKFYPMIEATDMFYQSIREQWDEGIAAGSYTYTALKQVEVITLSGDSGDAVITGITTLPKTISFNTDLETTAESFVTNNAAAYLVEGVVLTSSSNTLIFTVQESGVPFAQPSIANSTGDLDGVVTASSESENVIVYGPEYRANKEAGYEYKVNDGYIYTNFETGFIEIVYTGFATDDHGFPMIPDDQRFIEAVRWSLMEHLDYKKWRTAEISDKVYQHSEQNRDWYIASARSKASIPSLDKMESIKNMFLRMIPKINEHDTYFKYSNRPEQMYIHNSRYSRKR
jgi:hypothetical protein